MRQQQTKCFPPDLFNINILIPSISLTNRLVGDDIGKNINLSQFADENEHELRKPFM